MFDAKNNLESIVESANYNSWKRNTRVKKVPAIDPYTRAVRQRNAYETIACDHDIISSFAIISATRESSATSGMSEYKRRYDLGNKNRFRHRLENFQSLSESSLCHAWPDVPGESPAGP